LRRQRGPHSRSAEPDCRHRRRDGRGVRRRPAHRHDQLLDGDQRRRPHGRKGPVGHRHPEAHAPRAQSRGSRAVRRRHQRRDRQGENQVALRRRRSRHRARLPRSQHRQRHLQGRPAEQQGYPRDRAPPPGWFSTTNESTIARSPSSSSSSACRASPNRSTTSRAARRSPTLSTPSSAPRCKQCNQNNKPKMLHEGYY